VRNRVQNTGQDTGQDSWSSPSGSRWEPVPQDVVPSSAPTPALRTALDVREGVVEPRRRYRRPALAVLLTLLGVGTVTAGAAYEHSGGSSPAGPVTSQVAGADHGGRRAHGTGGERPGNADDAPGRTADGRAPRVGGRA
jgi:hypothetical protein